MASLGLRKTRILKGSVIGPLNKGDREKNFIVNVKKKWVDEGKAQKLRGVPKGGGDGGVLSAFYLHERGRINLQFTKNNALLNGECATPAPSDVRHVLHR